MVLTKEGIRITNLSLNKNLYHFITIFFKKSIIHPFAKTDSFKIFINPDNRNHSRIDHIFIKKRIIWLYYADTVFSERQPVFYRFKTNILHKRKK